MFRMFQRKIYYIKEYREKYLYEGPKRREGALYFEDPVRSL